MNQYRVIKDALVLKPNKDHQTFQSDGITKIPSGSIVEGQERYINGLRRGEPFTYSLFFTSDGKIIYLNCVESVKPDVEVLMNADGTQKQKIVKIGTNKNVLIAGLAGGVLGLAYAHHKKMNTQNKLILASVGALISAGTVYAFQKSKK